MNKIILITLFFVFSIKTETSVDPNQNLEHLAIAVDFHGVLGRTDHAERAKGIASAFLPKNWTVIKNFASFLASRSENKKNKNPDQGIDFYFEKRLCDGSLSEKQNEVAMQIYAAYKPDQELVKFLRELKNKGAKIILHSNIGDSALNHVLSKYEDLNDLFDGQRISNSQSNFVSKKEPESATQLKETILSIDPQVTKIIMIDDSKEKLDVAKKTLGDDLIAYYYKGVKTLKEDLKNLLNKIEI